MIPESILARLPFTRKPRPAAPCGPQTPPVVPEEPTPVRTPPQRLRAIGTVQVGEKLLSYRAPTPDTPPADTTAPVTRTGPSCWVCGRPGATFCATGCRDFESPSRVFGASVRAPGWTPPLDPWQQREAS